MSYEEFQKQQQLAQDQAKLMEAKLNLIYIVIAIHLTIPGFQRLIQLLQGADFNQAVSSLITGWISHSVVIYALVYAFTSRKGGYINTFMISLFYTLITLLGLLGFGEQYLYFLGVYIALAGLIKIVPFLYRRINTRCLDAHF